MLPTEKCKIYLDDLLLCLSKKDLATALNVTTNTIRNWEERPKQMMVGNYEDIMALHADKLPLITILKEGAK